MMDVPFGLSCQERLGGLLKFYYKEAARHADEVLYHAIFRQVNSSSDYLVSE